jgi:hypothetical protein
MGLILQDRTVRKLDFDVARKWRDNDGRIEP